MADQARECFPYIHGFSPEEQARLLRQAEAFEHIIYQDVNYSETQKLIEIGSGVGAQTDVLLRRYPKLNVTCVDISEKQIAAAKAHLQTRDFAKGRYEIHQKSAEDLGFRLHEFDGAFICWLLEHVPNPIRVLEEAHRVLRPGSPIVITEVMNFTFFLDPYSPCVWKYWMAFNDFQYENSGDPFVGGKLGQYLLKAGFKNIRTELKNLHLDNRHPKKRIVWLKDWKELLFSAKTELLDAGYVDQELVTNAEKEFDAVIDNDDAILYYSFMQAFAEA